MIGWPALPYELIGKAVVALLAIVSALLLVVVAIVAFLFVWCRGWRWLSDRMYKGYSINEGDRPPLWKLRVAAVSAALSRLQFKKIPAVYREATELANDP